ncbi:MAG: twin-arginine translocation signal domain-containing protein [Acidobacteria bacterium]|nr:twin-arginine translocation signal domain-containing protein [Planctomycetota bacterium]MBE3135733.1 twin-arginine translocation signal domain-containing protein [Acidobacteriota bacterium]
MSTRRGFLGMAGAAAANGRLYVAEEDGSLTCFGKR